MVNYYSAMIKKILTTCFGLVFGFCVFGVGLVAIAILVTYPKLPSLDSLQHYQPKMPLTIYSADGEVIGMYGEQRREFTKIGDFQRCCGMRLSPPRINAFPGIGGWMFGVLPALPSAMSCPAACSRVRVRLRSRWRKIFI